jgi:hypothetical protein
MVTPGGYLMMNPRGKPLNAAIAQARIFAGEERCGQNPTSPKPLMKWLAVTSVISEA